MEISYHYPTMENIEHDPRWGALARRMESNNYSSRGLAEAAGLNQTAVRDILKGRSKNPGYGTLAKLAQILQCEVIDIAPSDFPTRRALSIGARRQPQKPLARSLRLTIDQEVTPDQASRIWAILDETKP